MFRISYLNVACVVSLGEDWRVVVGVGDVDRDEDGGLGDGDLVEVG